MVMKPVLRVGVFNNFNFTEAEIRALNKFNSAYSIFVNSNSFVTITDDYPSIITINPYLDSWQPPVGDLSNVKACRVKWVEGARDNVYKAQMDALTWSMKNGIPVLLTFMRFVSRASLSRFVNAGSEHEYRFEASYYRLPSYTAKEVYARICRYAEDNGYSLLLVHACDLEGYGCPSCGNCGKLTFGDQYDGGTIHSLSLEESGDNGKCIFHCPDCWAKRLSRIAKFKYGEVTTNRKQQGKTKHG